MARLHLSPRCRVGRSGLLRCCGSKKSVLIKLNWKHASRPRSSFVKERRAHIKVCCNDMVKDLSLRQNILFYLSGSRDEAVFQSRRAFYMIREEKYFMFIFLYDQRVKILAQYIRAAGGHQGGPENHWLAPDTVGRTPQHPLSQESSKHLTGLMTPRTLSVWTATIR